MKSLQPEYIKSLRFAQLQLSTLKVIGEYQGKQTLYQVQTPEMLESLRKLSMIESSESSNRIEGITAPHKRIEDIVLQKSTPINRSEQEIAGYRDALALIHESAEYMAFTPNVILQLHRMLYNYLPNPGGHWKMTDNEIVEKDVNGKLIRVRFKPTPAVATPQAIESLTDNYRNAIETITIEPLVVVPLAIFDFLCIHPFSDGNGRCARLLTLMLLYHFHYDVGRYISLERIFEESKETYYECLFSSSINWHSGKHDVMPWLDYFWGALLKAYKELETRVGTIVEGKGYKTEQIKLVVERKIGPFSIGDIEHDCPGVSRDMVRKILRKLRDEGVIEAIGTGRGAKWIKKIGAR